MEINFLTHITFYLTFYYFIVKILPIQAITFFGKHIREKNFNLENNLPMKIFAMKV